MEFAVEVESTEQAFNGIVDLTKYYYRVTFCNEELQLSQMDQIRNTLQRLRKVAFLKRWHNFLILLISAAIYHNEEIGKSFSWRTLKKITFLFGIHCHQPVGNFDHVFVKLLKLLSTVNKTLGRHPKFVLHCNMSVHLSNGLKQMKKLTLIQYRRWFQKSRLKLGGGFYDLFLSVFPKRRFGQLNMMSDYLTTLWSASAGIWLTERIWDHRLHPLLNEPALNNNIDDAYLHIQSSGKGHVGIM